MPADASIFEFITVANMAGVEELKAGMLGVSAGALGVGLALAAVVIVGKAAVENYKKQEDATNQLKQATDAYNESAGTTTTTVGESAKVIQAAQDAASKANDALTVATNATTKATWAYQDAVTKHGAASEQARIAAINLTDAEIHKKAAMDASTDAQVALTAATATTTTQVYRQGINLTDLTAAYDRFKAANAGFISDQFDTETALAAIVRSGENEIDAIRILGDALDLSAIKHENVSDAAKALDLALAGNVKALKEFGITSADVAAITKDKTLTTEQQHLALLTLIESKTRDGRNAIDATTQSQNKLTQAWQDFTKNQGPDFVQVWQQFNIAAAASLGFIGQAITDLDRLGHAISGTRANAALRNTQDPGRTPTSIDRANSTVAGLGGTAAQPAVINIHIDQGAYIDGVGVDNLANRVAQRLGYTTGQ